MGQQHIKMPFLKLAKGVGAYTTASSQEHGSQFDPSLPHGKSGC